MGSNLPDNFVSEATINKGSSVRHKYLMSEGVVLDMQSMPNAFDYETIHAYVNWERGKPTWVEVSDLELEV